MTKSHLLLLIFMATSVGCGAVPPAVKPDDMSAAEHRKEAAKERAEAGEHTHQYDPGAARVAPTGAIGTSPDGNSQFSASVYNPTETHLARADQHQAHARQHDKAAQALERFEEVECRNLPPSSRAACPLLSPVTRIDDIEGGVRVTLVPGSRVATIVSHMRCHYAYARARGFEERVSCPLYMKGVDIRTSRDGAAVEITTADAKAVGELRGRARQEAIYTRADRP
jgi:hypothetical protein